MRKLIFTSALVMALGLAVLWSVGGFDLLTRWAAEGQRSFQNAMAGSLRQLRAGETGALLGLLGVAFAYGFFHAVGPGHGKILIGGYGAASQVRLWPLAGVALGASLTQSTTAVVLVYGAVLLFEAGRETVLGLGQGAMTKASLIAIGAIGLWLVWRGVRGLRALVRARSVGVDFAQSAPAHTTPVLVTSTTVIAAHEPGPLARHGSGPGDEQGQASRAGPHVPGRGQSIQGHSPGTEVCDICGHRHGPSVEEVAGLHGWRDAAMLIAAIAIRPCTGALFLLILTWNMGLQAAGIAGAYAMGLGTAAVTVAVAVLSVSAREGALLWAGRLAVLRLAVPVIELAVGAVVMLVAGQVLLRGGW